MNRRRFSAALVPMVTAWAQSDSTTLRGRLLSGRILETAAGRMRLSGDEPTLGVLDDSRVIGMQMELIGERRGSDELVVGPIHKRAMYVLQNEKRLFVTYWCDICSIRTYTPGQCWCCQEQTELDLRERYD